jgi:maltooligosyltrehalose trehalohydrolase
VEVVLPERDGRAAALRPVARGYHLGEVSGVGAGDLYLYRLYREDGVVERPDPASRSQPQGVHGPSLVVEPAFAWRDGGWRGPPLSDYVLYELHVGTFTPEGDFAAVIPRLAELKELGVTAVELMPVAQFPGERNWGYDGAYPFAVQASYGGARGLKELVQACHRTGLAAVLDVVYNHLGPEGNYLREFGPYFSDRYHGPWGEAVNFDGPHSDEVCRYFLENALRWLEEFHFDALRLDAVHAIWDLSARPFLAMLAERVRGLAAEGGRRLHLIAETAANDSRTIRPAEQGGLHLDGQWNDDFHHALHTLLTGERDGYYQDFGRLEDLAKSYREAYVYTGQYSPYYRRRQGNPATGLEPWRFVVFSQNHDQVGNRMLGERLGRLAGFEAQKLAAAAVILSPFLPLLFMGQEYGETAPFPYFISHGDPELVEAVRAGRKEEFSAFAWQGEPPDPQDPATREAAVLAWESRKRGGHAELWALHRELLRLRREEPALAVNQSSVETACLEEPGVLVVLRGRGLRRAALVLNFGGGETSPGPLPPGGPWQKALDTADPRWGGPGSPAPERCDPRVRPWRLAPHSAVLYTSYRED